MMIILQGSRLVIQFQCSPSLVKSGQISKDVIQRKADTVKTRFGRRPTNQAALMSSLATFIHHNYITTVNKMVLVYINLSEVAHASSLADVTVTNSFYIINVTGNIATILSKIKCPMLCISKMRLSTEDTAALVQGMQTSVEEVRLGYGGPVELDMGTLLTYDGQGHCGEVQCWGEARERYGDQLATWGETMGWSVWKDSPLVMISRE